MTTKRTITLLSVSVAALLAVAAGVGFASSNGEAPLTGTDRERAEAAALAAVGGGEVLESEVGDGGAAYEVEIRRPDGSVVEVQLDEGFRVTGHGSDDDGAGEDVADEGADD